MAVNDIYQLTLFGELFNQLVVNIFFYRQFGEETVPANSATLLAQSFEEVFLVDDAPLISNLISNQMSYLSIRALNLFDGTDYAELLLGSSRTGANVDQCMPPFVAFPFRTSWLGSNIRRGMKRFAGVPEAMVSNGAIVPALAGTGLDTLADSLAAVLSPGNGTYTPVVVRRVKTFNAEEDRWEYSLPENLSQAYAVQATQWEWQPNVSTQNSRKFGRGA